MSQNSFKIDKSLVLKPQGTAPTSPEKGQMYVNSSTNLLNYYDGTNWNPVGYAVGIFAPTIATDATTGTAVALAQPATGVVEITSGTLVSVNNIPAPTSGSLEFILVNRTGVTVTITNNSGGTAANRIQTGTGADIPLLNRASLFLTYSTNESRWMVVGGTGAAPTLSSLGIRAGSQSVSSGATSVSVTFSTTLGSTSYALNPIFINTVDASPQYQPITVSAQSATGATFSWNAPTGSANYSIQYTAILNS
jgi:hypothetical protein